MNILIIGFGIFMIVIGITLIANPVVLFNSLKDNADKLWLHISAVVVRLLLGVLLIYQASASKFPVTIEVIGWIAIVASLILTLIGRNKFKRLMSWALSLLTPYGRIGGVLTLSFGWLLIYAFR